MNPPHPPRLATWILEHFTCGERDAALSGDLFEQFRGGRSVAWYWRQVLAACALSWYESLGVRAPLLAIVLMWSMTAPAWHAVCQTMQSENFENWLSSLFGPIWIIPAAIAWITLHSIFLWTGLLLFGALCAALGVRIPRDQFKYAFSLAPVIFVPVYGALYLAVSLYWFSIFQRFQLPASFVSQVGDLRPLADVIRIPYLIALLGSLWRPLTRLAVRERVKTHMPSGGIQDPASSKIGSVDLTGMSGFVGFFVSAGLLNATIAALLVCRLPASGAPSLGGIVMRATIYVAIGVLAGVLGAYFYWRRSSSPFRLHPPIPFHLFALVCASGWVWVPAAVLLSAQDSAATAAIGALLGVIIASGLRRAIPGRGEASVGPLRHDNELFAQTLATPLPEAHGYVIAICVYAAAYARRDHSNLSAAALFAIAAFLFAWNWNQPPQFVIPRHLQRRATLRLLRTALPAVLVTAWALMLGVAHRNEAANAESAFANTSGADAKRAQRVEPGVGPGGYESIILWPFPPKKQIIAPIPAPANYLGLDRSRPTIIRFDGSYWYFQPPELRPSRTAHQAHGTPLALDIQSSNDFPLLMEAHQRLIAPVRLGRCREMDVTVQNRDNAPGSFSVGLLLGDSSVPELGSLALGQQPVQSSQPGRFFFKIAPVAETLRFAIPAGSRLFKFDEITVTVIPEPEHAMIAPKVAVEQFELLPR